MKQFGLNMENYQKLARQAAAEGCVLLENRNHALPLKKEERIAVYGRIAFTYYKSGLGSGGLVNTGKVDGILDALKKENLNLDEKLEEIYRSWIEKHPFDEGEGWGKVPWSQEEMPVTEEMLACGEKADAALIVIGRTAGEDQDNTDAPGGYRLTKEEEQLIQQVCQRNRRSIVVLNTGNIMDMSWVERYHPQAVLYVWQGGQEGGHAAADVLMGKVNPSGRLTDTIAQKISDYPSDTCFGSETENVYQEDIYVGYRYFETFAKEKVQYPFGYGLSYTTFSIEGKLISRIREKNGEIKIRLEARVTNTGECAGREVLQCYAQVPQGKLGNPLRRLVYFFKTEKLQPGESVSKMIEITGYDLASYDDGGVTGNRSAYVLEQGTYRFYIGSDVRSAAYAGECHLEAQVAEQLQEAMAPVSVFQRMKPKKEKDGYRLTWEEVPVRTVDQEERRRKERPEGLKITGDQGWKLIDVLDGKITLDAFTAQLSEEDLTAIFRGEGMCSPKVTAGTAAAFGGVTEHLQELGIPAACCADGPSGIRMDCGTRAFSLPNGTALGCTFDEKLVEELYTMVGQEIRLNKIDSLLGPGINIHRHPLNGRNFEYISEDPYLTGKIAAAQVRGMAKHQIAGTIKHFCANNQETARTRANSVVSERALREIYLKGFEIAVKEGGAWSVMTTYGPVNGVWTAGSYDLCTTILRKEWGFSGIVMTDWWAMANYEGMTADKTMRAPMAAAQNDIFMVTSDAKASMEEDDMQKQLECGWLTCGELQRNAENILGFLLRSPALLHMNGRICQEELDAMNRKEDGDVLASDLKNLDEEENGSILISGDLLHPKSGNADVFGIHLKKKGSYRIHMKLRSDLGGLAQIPVTVYCNNTLKTMVSVQGSEGDWLEIDRNLDVLMAGNHYIKFYYGGNGLEFETIRIYLEEEHD